MFDTLKALVPKDQDFPERTHCLEVFRRVLCGEIYNTLQYQFYEERNEATQEYIKLAERKPSVRYGLCRIVVSDSVSLLFSEGHFPSIDSENKETSETLNKIVKDTVLNWVMIDAATRGSIGSVVIFMQVLKNRLYFKVLETVYLTPTWDPQAPETLSKVTEKYKVDGKTLKEAGYTIADSDMNTKFWFMRVWDTTREIWYQPWKVADTDVSPVEDTTKTVSHSLGFVPMVWIKNLPGGDDIDGLCTFELAIDTGIEIDYQLSQAGRGLRYSSDPTLLIREPASEGNTHNPGNALIVSENGDAKMLEIGGTAANAVLEYVKALREMAMETVGGNRAEASKLSSAQSGRAMELMNQGLIWLADKLRISYGEKALLELMAMIQAASKKFKLTYKDGTPIGEISSDKPLTLKWPKWYQPTADDRTKDATSIKTLRDAGVLSTETAVKAISDDYDIEDVAAEVTRLEGEAEANAEREAKSKGNEPKSDGGGKDPKDDED